MTGYFAGLAARVHTGVSEEQPALIRPRLPSLYESAGDHLPPPEPLVDSTDGLIPSEETPIASTEQPEQGFDVRQAIQQTRQPSPTIQPTGPQQSVVHEPIYSPGPDAQVQPDSDSPNISPARQPDRPGTTILPMPDRRPDPTIRVEAAGQVTHPAMGRAISPDGMAARAEPTASQAEVSLERQAIEPDYDHDAPQAHTGRGQYQLEGMALIPRQSTADPAETLRGRQADPNDVQSDPVVHVSIGRIEIRAATPPSPPAPDRGLAVRPAPIRRPALTLDDYLERRNGGDL